MASARRSMARWRLPTVGLDPTPVGVSDDGRTHRARRGRADAPRQGRRASRSSTGLASRRHPDRRAARGVRIRRALARWLDPVCRRASRRSARRPLPGPRASTPRRARCALERSPTRTRATRRWPAGRSPRSQRPDGMVFTLYHGAEHPFIHALSSIDAWALCIDLPATGADDPTAAADWGLTATADGTLDRGRERDSRGRGRDPAVRPRGPPDRHVRPVGVDRGLPRQVRPPGGWGRRSPDRRLPARLRDLRGGTGWHRRPRRPPTCR